MSKSFRITRYAVRIAILMILMGLLPLSANAQTQLSAAISLKVSLEAGRADLEKTLGEKIIINYGASGTLAQQITAGAPVDLFISADRATVEKLAGKNVVDKGQAQVLATNDLVLVAPAADKSIIKDFASLTDPAVRHVAIGEPKMVPAGRYARQTLESLKLYKPLEEAQKIVTGENVAAVLAYVSRGEVDAALVYATDAYNNPKVRVVATAPPATHDLIEYVIVPVKGAAHYDSAQKLQVALLSASFQGILKAHAFGPPSAAPTPASAP